MDTDKFEVTRKWLEIVRETLESLSDAMYWEYNSRDASADDLIGEIDEMIGKADDNG